MIPVESKQGVHKTFSDFWEAQNILGDFGPISWGTRNILENLYGRRETFSEKKVIWIHLPRDLKKTAPLHEIRRHELRRIWQFILISCPS